MRQNVVSICQNMDTPNTYSTYQK